MRNWLNVYLMFVHHPQRCPNIKTILCQCASGSRLLPVGWIDVQLMMYLLPAQAKLEFIADKISYFFEKFDQ